MTVGEIIRSAEGARPGAQLSLGEFMNEINACALDIYQNIISKSEGCPDFKGYSDEAQELFLPDNYAPLFKYRLIAMIDIANGDISRYTNNMLLYNNMLGEFADWFNRSNMPKQRARLRWC